MLTPRENVLEVINWGKPDYMPMETEAFHLCGLGVTPLFEQPWVTGKDPFGVKWIVNTVGAMHDTSQIMFDDVNDWKKHVIFPDLDEVDITEAAEEEMREVDRTQKLVAFYHPCGIFERLASFIGFENALMALFTDPEACKEFFDAMTDYKIKVAGKIIDAYKPDVYGNFDDVASAKCTLMSPETYRQLIKPYHIKFSQYIKSRSCIYMQHTCGKCETLLEDFVDEGVQIWHSAQLMNDLQGIQQRFRGRLVVMGGWDSSGPPGYIDASEEVVRAEVCRNMEEYGSNGGFILSPVLMNKKGNSIFFGDDRFPALFDEWMKVRNYR